MITNKINTILNNSQQNDLDTLYVKYVKLNLKAVSSMAIEEHCKIKPMFLKQKSLNL